jgi:hypothetical protein
MPRPEDVNILLDVKHNSNSTGISLDYFTLLNWTQSQDFNLQVNDAGDLSGTLSGIDILIILKPDLAFEPQEITAITSFIRSGGSMLIGGSQTTADNNINEATRHFGFEFLNSTARYINSTNLIDPVGENNTLPLFNITSFDTHPIIDENQLVPLTDILVDELTYAGAIINQNDSWITDFLLENDLQSSGIQFDTYSLVSGNETIFADRNDDGTVGENETIGQDNVLVSITETSENDGRIVALGSASIFNNTFFGRYPSNQLFFERTLQWLAKMYATIQNEDYELSDFTARQGENIQATLEIYTVNKSTIGFANITLQVMRNSIVEKQFNVTNINQTHFECEIQTAKIIRGTVSVNIVAHKRGYGYNTTKSYAIQIFPRPPEKLPIPILYIITFVLSVGVGAAAIAFFTIRVLKGSQLPVVTDIEDAEETEDDEEEIDLDEYEVESTDKNGND